MRAQKYRVRSLLRWTVVATVGWCLAGCGEVTRENPFDPGVGGGITLRDQLI
ncbi:MAG: hypothetical protein HOH74_19095, partial [Gemmatimonadetes bacterium]|nr:hypothetical protein [Gemmatimonadota bacterium]